MFNIGKKIQSRDNKRIEKRSIIANSTLLVGSVVDMITTYVGINYFGLSEFNPLGVYSVYLLNIIMIGTLIFLWNEKRSGYIDYGMILVGIWRFIAGISNIILIGVL